MNSKKKVIIRTYRGTQEQALAAFQKESVMAAEEGYFPTSQTWAPGAYGCGAFIGALLLCIVLIGFLVFVYMLIVKPPGTLSVTYELREPSPVKTPETAEEQTCPQCAERVKAAALVCRFCGHKFVTATQ